MKSTHSVFINDAVKIVFAFSCVIAGGIAMFTGNLYRGLGGFAALICLPCLPLFRRIFMLKQSRYMENEMLLFIFLAFLLGVVLGWYSLIYSYDKVVHFLSGIIFTTVGLCIFWLIREDKSASRSKDYPVAVCFSFFFAQFIAGFWEIFEFISGLITGHDSQNVAATGVGDTMGDMIACMIGSFVMSTVIFICLKHKRSCFVMHPVDEFYELNCLHPNNNEMPTAQSNP